MLASKGEFCYPCLVFVPNFHPGIQLDLSSSDLPEEVKETSVKKLSFTQKLKVSPTIT